VSRTPPKQILILKMNPYSAEFHRHPTTGLTNDGEDIQKREENGSSGPIQVTNLNAITSADEAFGNL
jgi:hypothetical protein